MAGQGGRRPEPYIGVAARERRRRRPRRRVVALTPADAEEGGPLFLLALPLPGSASPPLLRPGGAGEGGGGSCGWRTTWDAGALLPGYGLLPQQCWWERKQALNSRLSNVIRQSITSRFNILTQIYYIYLHTVKIIQFSATLNVYFILLA